MIRNFIKNNKKKLVLAIGLGVFLAIAMSFYFAFDIIRDNNLPLKSDIAHSDESVAKATIISESSGSEIIETEAMYNPNKSDFVLGKSEVNNVLIAYVSLSCHHCAKFHHEVFKVIKEKYINTGKIKFIYRNYPLNQQALDAAMIVACDGNSDSYYRLMDSLFASQDSWAFSEDYRAKLKNIAVLNSLSGAKFDKCVSNDVMRKEIVESTMKATEKLAISATPTLFLNGKKIKSSDISGIQKEINDIISK